MFLYAIFWCFWISVLVLNRKKWQECLPGGTAIPYPLESSKPPTFCKLHCLSTWYSIEVDSMKKAYLPSSLSTLSTPSELLLVNIDGLVFSIVDHICWYSAIFESFTKIYEQCVFVI